MRSSRRSARDPCAGATSTRGSALPRERCDRPRRRRRGVELAWDRSVTAFPFPVTPPAVSAARGLPLSSPSDGPRDRGMHPQSPVSWRTCAMLYARMDAAPTPETSPSPGRVCEACGKPLATRQRPGARYHGGACRAAGTRARRRAAVLAELDALAGRSPRSGRASSSGCDRAAQGSAWYSGRVSEPVAALFRVRLEYLKQEDRGTILRATAPVTSR